MLTLIPRPASVRVVGGACAPARRQIGVPPRHLDASRVTVAVATDKLRLRAGFRGEADLVAGEVDGEGEGYELVVDDRIELRAAHAHGVHNGLMTLLQLAEAGEGIPRLAITDAPRFPWRGMLLDPARSFLPPAVVRSFIDRLAELKLDVLHWHLTDDHGWRVESRAFARLHEVGGVLGPLSRAKRSALRRHGWDPGGRGYYTRGEIRDIVAYAAARHVMVVPEIDVPGHTSALLAAHPELSCSGAPVPLRTRPGIFRSALCPGDERVYRFLETLFAEVAELFPAPYVHIGGDEVAARDWVGHPKNRVLADAHDRRDRPALQAWFVDRVAGILADLGRTPIGWDEITSYAPADAVVQVWRRHDYARDAMDRGNRVILSPMSHNYLDIPSWLLRTRRVYGFEPVPERLDPALRPSILGGEVNLWGEFVDLDDIDAKAFPRVIAHAEVMWSPREARDWGDFRSRLARLRRSMEERGTRFGRW